MSDTTTQSYLGPPPPSIGPFTTLEPEKPAVGTASVVTGRRIVAGLLDFLPMLALMIAIGDRDGASVMLTGWPILVWMLAGIGYYGVAELLTGTSPGKAVVGLCVRQLDTSEATRQQIVARTLPRFIDMIAGYLLGLIVALTSSKRQRIGDKVAGTVVLQRAEVTKEKFPARSAVILTALVLATYVASGFLYAESKEAESRIGNFDIETEVVPYTAQVIEDGFRPASSDNINAHMVPDLVPVNEVEQLMIYMVETAGELSDDYEVLETSSSDFRLDATRTAEVADVLYAAEFENGPGRLVVSVADIDGELKLVGFRFRLF